jgi:hypothetical protein
VVQYHWAIRTAHDCDVSAVGRGCGHDWAGRALILLAALPETKGSAMLFDPVLLSRIQFAWVIGRHILLPAFTVLKRRLESRPQHEGMKQKNES